MAKGGGSISVAVESRIVGGRAEPTGLERILVELERAQITVGDLIRRTVEEQVWELRSKRKQEADEARRALDRHYLTEGEVATLSRSGAVRLPSKRALKRLDVDPEVEVQKALRSFGSGTYMVFVDGRQVADLGERVLLSESSKVTFLRLTPLVGG